MNGGLCTKEGWQQVMSWKPAKESNKESTSTKDQDWKTAGSASLRVSDCIQS